MALRQMDSEICSPLRQNSRGALASKIFHIFSMYSVLWAPTLPPGCGWATTATGRVNLHSSLALGSLAQWGYRSASYGGATNMETTHVLSILGVVEHHPEILGHVGSTGFPQDPNMSSPRICEGPRRQL